MLSAVTLYRLTCTLSTSRDMLGWMNYKPGSRQLEKHQQPRYADYTTLIAESKQDLKSPLMRMKEESERIS